MQKQSTDKTKKKDVVALNADVTGHYRNHGATARNRRTFIVAAYDSQGYLAPGFDLDYPYQQSPLYSASTASPLTLVGDQLPQQQFTPPNFHTPHPNPQNPHEASPRPSRRQRVGGQVKPPKSANTGTSQNTNFQMPTPEAAIVNATEAAAAVANKPKRVRTGCLTCRERHLKCDEGLPHCQNCRKSSRVCKRGVRLNFIDTQVKSPPIMPPTADWKGKYYPSIRIN